jgi:hypothetical protein
LRPRDYLNFSRGSRVKYLRCNLNPADCRPVEYCSTATIPDARRPE